MVNTQLETWRGAFGDEYTDRMGVNWQVQVPPFREAVGDLRLDELVLEVGCNRGLNLRALGDILVDHHPYLLGIEPNRYARDLTKDFNPKAIITEGHIANIPFPDGIFQLVFTAGVLIHIADADLQQAMSEVYRVSKQYILVIEYDAEQDTPMEYRGLSNMLWARPFGRYYQEAFSTLTLVSSGPWKPTIPNSIPMTWWLFEK